MASRTSFGGGLGALGRALLNGTSIRDRSRQLRLQQLGRMFVDRERGQKLAADAAKVQQVIDARNNLGNAFSVDYGVPPDVGKARATQIIAATTSNPIQIGDFGLKRQAAKTPDIVKQSVLLRALQGKAPDLTKVQGGVSFNPNVVPGDNTFEPVGDTASRITANRALAGQRDQSAAASRALTPLKAAHVRSETAHAKAATARAKRPSSRTTRGAIGVPTYKQFTDRFYPSIKLARPATLAQSRQQYKRFKSWLVDHPGATWTDAVRFMRSTRPRVGPSSLSALGDNGTGTANTQGNVNTAGPGKQNAAGPHGGIVRTGTYKGHLIVQYADGTVAYGDK